MRGGHLSGGLPPGQRRGCSQITLGFLVIKCFLLTMICSSTLDIDIRFLWFIIMTNISTGISCEFLPSEHTSIPTIHRERRFSSRFHSILRRRHFTTTNRTLSTVFCCVTSSASVPLFTITSFILAFTCCYNCIPMLRNYEKSKTHN